MINFLFYKYSFSQIEERHLFTKEGTEVSSSYLNDRLAEFLAHAQSLNLYDIKADKQGVQTSEIYANDIQRSEDGIVLLQVRNNKHKKVMPIDQTTTQEVGHYPYCSVIIDTRPQSMAILVQQKKEAFSNADDVVGLIVNSISRELGLPDLSWKFSTEKRLCVGSIWDIVRLRTYDGQDRVKNLTITIDSKKPNESNEVDKALQLVLEKLSVPDGELKLMSDDQAHKILDETKEDVRNTVDMLIENQYRMKIGFEKSGTVEYGKRAEAVYGVSDTTFLEFENGTIVMLENGTSGYNIVPWLNTLMTEDGSHTYIQPESKMRNGRRKKSAIE